MINKFFPKDKSVSILDLGCGHGALIYFSHRAGFSNARGIDVSLQQVTLAKELNISNVEQGDLMETLSQFSLSSLDVVISFDVVEHLSKSELIDLIDAVYLVLKPGGRWIIHAPNGCSPFFGAIRYGDFTHEQAFTPLMIAQVLKASGFREIICEECGPQVYGVKSAIRVITWRVVRFLYRIVLAAETGDFSRNSILTQNFYAVGIK
jgi:2-polyprenyl-3-methyl-5-hydroxy-6-metoxy-1,4-benzoquinol methylase